MTDLPHGIDISVYTLRNIPEGWTILTGSIDIAAWRAIVEWVISENLENKIVLVDSTGIDTRIGGMRYEIWSKDYWLDVLEDAKSGHGGVDYEFAIPDDEMVLFKLKFQ